MSKSWSAGLRRVLVGLLLGFAVLVIAFIVPFAVVFGRRGYGDEIGSAASCLLNAVAGGSRIVTFSAWSWRLLLRVKRRAIFRVRLVDALNFEPGHCQRSYQYHVENGLMRDVRPDTPAVQLVAKMTGSDTPKTGA